MLPRRPRTNSGSSPHISGRETPTQTITGCPDKMLTEALHPNSYEPVGSRTGVLENTKDGYEMIKVRESHRPLRIMALGY
jgi:hypothetical protein